MTNDDATWDRCREDFRPDGALRDIYVMNASLRDWADFLRALPGWYTASYSVNGKTMRVPRSVAQVTWSDERLSALLAFNAGRASVCCHFFRQDELEFDFVPNVIESAEDFAEIARFIRRLGLLLGKTVLMTFENQQERPIAKWSPAHDRLLCVGQHRPSKSAG